MTVERTAFARTLRQKSGLAEQRVWALLRSGRIDDHKFRRQHPIGRYVADFACDRLRLVIEIDGDTHDVDDEQDRIRTGILNQHGYRVVRYSNVEVMQNLEGVLMNLAAVIAEMRPPLPTLSPEGERAFKVSSNTERNAR